MLAALAALFPWELGEKADPFAPAPPDIRPEWYFMFMFQTLKLVPGGEIAGLEYEAIPILGFGLAALLLLLVPFLDREVVRRGRSPLFTAVGVVAVVYMVALTAWGYRSLVPVYAVLGAGIFVWLFARAIERQETAGVDEARGASSQSSRACWRRGRPRRPSRAPRPARSCHANAEVAGEASPGSSSTRRAVPRRGRSLLPRLPRRQPRPGAGGSLEAMDEEYAANPFRGAPERADIPAFCGRCHSDPTYMKRFKPGARVDQEREYWTSRHGELLKRGDAKVATCIDCHGAHGILPPRTPRLPSTRRTSPRRAAAATRTRRAWPAYRLPDGRPLPVDQYERWRRSVHAEFLLGARGPLGADLQRLPWQPRRAAAGAGVRRFVCGQCHGREAELFRASPKRAAFESTGS